MFGLKYCALLLLVVLCAHLEVFQKGHKITLYILPCKQRLHNIKHKHTYKQHQCVTLTDSVPLPPPSNNGRVAYSCNP